MPYATYSDAERLYGSKELTSWLPRVSDGSTAQDLLAERLASASGRVDGYLAQGGYPVPLDLVSLEAQPGGAELVARFRQCTVILALFELAPGGKEAKKSLAEAHRLELEWLEHTVAAGKLPGIVHGTGHARVLGVADPCARPEIAPAVFHRFRAFGGGS